MQLLALLWDRYDRFGTLRYVPAHYIEAVTGGHYVIRVTLLEAVTGGHYVITVTLLEAVALLEAS